MKQALDLKLTMTVIQDRVLGDNPLRVYALLANDGVDKIFLGMGKPAEVDRGIPIAGGGNYEINLTNPWSGEIYAVAAAGTPALLIQEW